MISSSEQSARDRAEYMSQRAAKLSQEVQAIKVACVKWTLGIAAAIALITWMVISNNQQAEAHDIQVQAKYATWVAYRGANCKVVEKLMGLSIQSGKFSSNDNAVVYDCKNGIKYMMSDNAVNNIKNHHGALGHIPEPSKD